MTKVVILVLIKLKRGVTYLLVYTSTSICEINDSDDAVLTVPDDSEATTDESTANRRVEQYNDTKLHNYYHKNVVPEREKNQRHISMKKPNDKRKRACS